MVKSKTKITKKSSLTAEHYVPAVIAAAGKRTAKLFLEYFAATIRNTNTRQAYMRCVRRFFAWCEERGIDFERIEPMAVAAYIEEFTHEAAAETVKQHLAAIRKLFDYLVINQALPVNPAASVRGPRVETLEGKTPVLSAEEARALLNAIDVAELRGQRDRAIVALMLYSFARVSAVARLKVEDFHRYRDNSWQIRVKEKGSKSRELPVHPEAATFIKTYVANGRIGNKPTAPLFQTMRGRSRVLSGRPMHRNEILAMVKRRAKDAGLSPTTCCHTFRATGLTIYMENGGILQHAQRIAGHADPRTTQLYIRGGGEEDMEEIKKIDI